MNPSNWVSQALRYISYFLANSDKFSKVSIKVGERLLGTKATLYIRVLCPIQQFNIHSATIEDESDGNGNSGQYTKSIQDDYAV